MNACLVLTFFLLSLSLFSSSLCSKKIHSYDRDTCLTLSATNASKKEQNQSSFSLSLSFSFFFALLVVVVFSCYNIRETTCHAYLCSLSLVFSSLFSSYLTQSTIDLSYINIDAFVIDVTATYFITVINLLS